MSGRRRWIHEDLVRDRRFRCGGRLWFATRSRRRCTVLARIAFRGVVVPAARRWSNWTRASISVMSFSSLGSVDRACPGDIRVVTPLSFGDRVVPLSS